MLQKIEKLISDLEQEKQHYLEQIPLAKHNGSKKIFELRIEKLEYRVEQAEKLLNEQLGETENDEHN